MITEETKAKEIVVIDKFAFQTILTNEISTIVSMCNNSNVANDYYTRGLQRALDILEQMKMFLYEDKGETTQQ